MHIKREYLDGPFKGVQVWCPVCTEVYYYAPMVSVKPREVDPGAPILQITERCADCKDQDQFDPP